MSPPLMIFRIEDFLTGGGHSFPPRRTVKNFSWPYSRKELKKVGRPKNIKNQTRDQMKALGVYKPEFEPIIEVYSQLREQYKILSDRFIASNYDIEETTNTGSKKAPIVTTLESLRKDILAYATQLCLTPQGLLKTDDKAFTKKKQSSLANALKGLDI